MGPTPTSCNGDAALRRMFQARPPTGPLRAPLCCCCYGSVLFSRRSPLRSSDRGKCRACTKPYCLLRLPLSSLNHSKIFRVVLSCTPVASRSPLPLLCIATSYALGSQLLAWWRGSAASKYAPSRCDHEWAASRRRLRGRKQATAATWLRWAGVVVAPGSCAGRAPGR